MRVIAPCDSEMAPVLAVLTAVAPNGKSTVQVTAMVDGVPAFELFVLAGLAASNGEARRLIRGGGARINDSVVGDEAQAISLADLDPAGAIKLSAGRKRHVLVKAS